jgi:hypothetical protein
MAEASSCLGHPGAPGMDMVGDGVSQADSTACIENGADCICAENASRSFAKSVRPHLQTFAAVLTSATKVAARVATVRVLSPRTNFERPFYLTDSFYNLSPKRGPPVS